MRSVVHVLCPESRRYAFISALTTREGEKTRSKYIFEFNTNDVKSNNVPEFIWWKFIYWDNVCSVVYVTLKDHIISCCTIYCATNLGYVLTNVSYDMSWSHISLQSLLCRKQTYPTNNVMRSRTIVYPTYCREQGPSLLIRPDHLDWKIKSRKKKNKKKFHFLIH